MWTPVPNPSPAPVPQNTFIPFQPHQRVDLRVAYQGIQEYGMQSRVEDIAIPGNAEGVQWDGQDGQMFIRSKYSSAGQNEGWGSRR